MKDRIQQFLQVENKSSAQFAEEIGVQASSVSHILSGRNNPSLDFILKMLAKFPDISTEWLLFGKGAMYKASKAGDLFAEEANNVVDIPEKQRMVIDNQIFDDNETIADHSREKSLPSHRSPERAEKIVIFYNDGSFTEHRPKE